MEEERQNESWFMIVNQMVRGCCSNSAGISDVTVRSSRTEPPLPWEGYQIIGLESENFNRKSESQMDNFMKIVTKIDLSLI